MENKPKHATAKTPNREGGKRGVPPERGHPKGMRCEEKCHGDRMFRNISIRNARIYAFLRDFTLWRRMAAGSDPEILFRSRTGNVRKCG